MTANEGKWDYVEGDEPEQHYDEDELESARLRMKGEKDTLDNEENIFHKSDKSFDYQEGGEKFKSRDQQQWYNATDQTYLDDEPHENRKVEGEVDENELAKLKLALKELQKGEDEAEEGYWRNSNPFDLTSELEYVEGDPPITPGPKPEEEADEGGQGSGPQKGRASLMPEQIGMPDPQNYDPYKATPKGDRLQDDPELSRMTEEAPEDIDSDLFGKESELWGTGIDEDDTYDALKKDKEEHDKTEEAKLSDVIKDLNKKNAPPDGWDEEDKVAEEESSISVAGPPAGTQPPANMFDDEEDEDKLLGESIEHKRSNHANETGTSDGAKKGWDNRGRGTHEEPKKDMIGSIKDKIKSGTPSSNMQDHLRKEYPNASDDQMRVAINKAYDEIQGTTSNTDNMGKNKEGGLTPTDRADFGGYADVTKIPDDKLAKYASWNPEREDLNKELTDRHDRKEFDDPTLDMSKLSDDKMGWYGQSYPEDEDVKKELARRDQHKETIEVGKSSKELASMFTDKPKANWNNLDALRYASVLEWRSERLSLDDFTQRDQTTLFSRLDKMLQYDSHIDTFKQITGIDGEMGNGYALKNRLWGKLSDQDKIKLLDFSTSLSGKSIESYAKATEVGSDEWDNWGSTDRSNSLLEFDFGAYYSYADYEWSNIQKDFIDKSWSELPADAKTLLESKQGVYESMSWEYLPRDTKEKLGEGLLRTTESEWSTSTKEKRKEILTESNTEHEPAGSSKGGQFTAGGGSSGGKHADMSEKDLIKSIKGGSKDWNDWGRNEKTEDAYAEIERRNKEIPTPKRPKGSGGTIFRDDPDAVSKMEAKVKYLEDVSDYWKKVTKFPNRDYHHHDQLGDAKWYALSNNSANLRDAKRKLEGIKAQQASGTKLVRNTTYKQDSGGKSKPRFYYSEEPKEEEAKEASIFGSFVDKYFEEEYVMDQDGMYKCKLCGARMDVQNPDIMHGFSPDEVTRQHMLTDHNITEAKATEERINSDTYYYDYSDYWNKGDSYVRSGLALQAGISPDLASLEWNDLPNDVQAKIIEAGYVTSYETYDNYIKKKAIELNTNSNPSIDDSYRQFVEPTEAPTGKTIVDQTYGVSEPETPDGQDLTGITIGDEENKLDFADLDEDELEGIAYGDEVKCDTCGDEFENLEAVNSHKKAMSDKYNYPYEAQEYDPSGEKDALDTDDDKVLDFFKQTGDEEIIEKTPPKIEYMYYKQHPFGIQQKGFYGEASLYDYVDDASNEPGGEEGDARCRLCGQFFPSMVMDPNNALRDPVNHLEQSHGFKWDPDYPEDIATEVSISTMNQAKIWWDNKYPERQWSDMRIGDRQHAILAFLNDPSTTITEGGVGSGRKPLNKSEDPKTKDKAHIGWKNHGIDDYIDKAEKEYLEGNEWLNNPEESIDLPRLRELEEKDRAGTATLDERNEAVTLMRKYSEWTDADVSNPYFTEGGLGSGKKDHKGWMRAIEEEHDYEFCDKCSMITEQVNKKCQMCGKRLN